VPGLGQHYRFLSKDRVSEADILAGHFQSTRDRTVATDGLVLVLHDTTEFTYQREDTEAIGITKSINSGRDKAGRLRSHTVCGILMHSSLAVTTEGLPLGLAAVKFWTRKKFKGTAALKKKVRRVFLSRRRKASGGWNVQQSTALLGDPGRCLHIGDRESDLYELFCTAREAGTHFLIRTCVDRLAGDGDHTIADEMEEVAVKGLHRIEVRDGNGDPDEAVLEIRYRKIRVLPPIGTETLSSADLDGDSRRGARDAEEQEEDRVEADRRPAPCFACGRHREARVVRFTMED